MKKLQLKGNVSAVKPHYALLTGAALFVILFVLRVVTLFTNTEYDTGFYTEKNALVYLFYILAVAGSLAVVILGYISGSMPTGKLNGKKNIGTGVASIAMCGAFALEGVKKLLALQEAAELNGLNLVEAAELNGSVRDLVELILAFVSCLPFIVYAIYAFTGKRKIVTYTAVLFLAPVLWSIVRVLSYFATTISYLVVGELFCEMYATVFLMIFLFCFARAVTGTGFENGTWTILVSGILAGMFCILAYLPRLILKLKGIVVDEYDTNDFFYIAGTFSFLFMLTYPMHIDEETAEVPAEAGGTESDISVAPFDNDND